MPSLVSKQGKENNFQETIQNNFRILLPKPRDWKYVDLILTKTYSSASNGKKILAD